MLDGVKRDDESVEVSAEEGAGNCSRLLESQSKMVLNVTQRELQGQQQKDFYQVEQIIYIYIYF